MAPKKSLSDVAVALATTGPVKKEPAKRRVRALLDGQWVFDTLDAVFVWENAHYPYFYIPLEVLQSGPGSISKTASDGRGFWLGNIGVASGKTAELVAFDKGELAGLVKIPANGLDAWYAEDEKILGPHPKDPYTRIECLPSTREVRIEVDGVVIARSTASVFLHETRLRTRYYLPPTSVLDWSYLVPSDTKSFCPYKGEAGWYHVKVNGKTYEDLVWTYEYPVPESARIQGHLAFYNEKVDVFIDGVKEER